MITQTISLSILVPMLLVVSLSIYLYVTSPPGRVVSKPMFPPPALPGGATYYPKYSGNNCSQTDQDKMTNCQKVYTECIDASLKGRANFPTCHKNFMAECMPIIRNCQQPVAEEDL